MRNTLNRSNFEKNNKQFTEGGAGASTATSLGFDSGVFRSHPSAMLKIKSNIMRNTPVTQKPYGVCDKLEIPAVSHLNNISTEDGFIDQWFKYIYFYSHEEAYMRLSFDYFLVHKKFPFKSYERFFDIIYGTPEGKVYED